MEGGVIVIGWDVAIASVEVAFRVDCEEGMMVDWGGRWRGKVKEEENVDGRMPEVVSFLRKGGAVIGGVSIGANHVDRVQIMECFKCIYVSISKLLSNLFT
jgi:hypothetical protein